MSVVHSLRVFAQDIEANEKAKGDGKGKRAEGGIDNCDSSWEKYGQ